MDGKPSGIIWKNAKVIETNDDGTILITYTDYGNSYNVEAEDIVTEESDIPIIIDDNIDDIIYSTEDDNDILSLETDNSTTEISPDPEERHLTPKCIPKVENTMEISTGPPIAILAPSECILPHVTECDDPALIPERSGSL